MRHTVALFILLAALVSKSLQAQYEIKLSNSYPPYNFVNEEEDLVGFNVDILNAIQDIYDTDINLQGGEWYSINEELNNGKIHAIAGTHYPGSPDNDYIYTRSTINTSHCFLYNGNYKNKFSLEYFRSLKKPLVALWQNDVLIRYVHSINPTAEFIFVNDYEKLVMALDRKDVTCIVAQKVAAMYYATKLGKDYIHSLNHQLLERSMGFKVAKSSPELAEILNNGLEVILANGQYQQIYNKWIEPYAKRSNPWQSYYKYFLLSGIIISVLSLFLLTANYVLKTRIRSKTKDLQHQLEVNSEIMKELEEQKNKAEESDRMKSAFLANMSHEIRTPMNGILGFTELLRTADYSSQEQEQFIQVIEQSGNRMLETINNIIDVSKLESGIEQAQHKEMNIKHMLIELHDFFIREAKVKEIQLILEEKETTSAQPFVSDEHKLNSILTNLIKNAIKFTSEGYVKVTYHIGKDFAEFWVSDTGIGIAQHKQASIFNQFEQGEGAYSRAYEGSGLGLSITKGYVDLLDGAIRVESEPQKGTTFYVRIPNHERVG
ncbi:Signal transduction histidine kinase [Saccharicrinis carchari]|uniref:histidine kinase n=2 Tax=Saccharicrinis carchari TaxID=1168039 RepID=A0A521EPP3_SACCC|nr:Signal transduction histidine kinase [Saccharicrinis carchari]